MEGMSINNLPIELLEHIISFLSSSERLKSTLISRRFAQAFNESPMNDVWLVVRADLVDEAKSIISNSTRQYKNIRICKADPLEFDSIIWTKLGRSLRRLEFNDCRYGSSRVFYSILHACPSLESLAIRDTCDASTWGQWLELPSGISLQNIQDATHNLSHLHLGFYVNADTLENMLVAMPNVSTISVSRFEQKSDFLNRIRGLLGTRRRITKIDWEPDLDPEIEMEQLLSIAYTSLEEVRIPSAPPGGEVYEQLEPCAKLRHLEIMLNETIRDFILQDILGNTQELEVLNLSDKCDYFYEDPNDVPLTHEAIMPILELTRLRELRLDLFLRTQYDDQPVEGFVRGLGQLLSLECLHLSEGIGLVEPTYFQNLARLPNLQDLTLDYLDWDVNCLRAITSDFKNLRRLSITCRGTRRHEALQESELERKVLDAAIHSRSDPRGERIKSSCLETLEMCCVPLTDVGLTCIAAHHSRLKDLKLTICDNITDAGLVNLLKKEPQLETLNVVYWDSSDGSFLEAFEELCPQLRLLKIKSCRNIRSSAVELFKSQRPTVLLEILPSY